MFLAETSLTKGYLVFTVKSKLTKIRKMKFYCKKSNLLNNTYSCFSIMFSTLLVANRGEIAVRIIRAARELDIKTYAIYTSVDKNALHVKLADEAFALVEDGKIPGYLDIDQIISICVREGIESVHPGYGFLSESEIFARKLTEKGIKFIGPPADVIELLGNKVKSRQKAIEAGLKVPQGSDIIQSEDDGIQHANSIGYPILVKAVLEGVVWVFKLHTMIKN